jgi:hypothetical protein
MPLAGYQAPYTNQWNLSVQRQIGENWLVSVNYLGNSQIHMTTSNLLNPAVFLGLGACTLQTVNSAGQLVSTSYPVCSTTQNQQYRRVLSLQNPLLGNYYAGIAYGDDGGTSFFEGHHHAGQLYLVSLSRGISRTSKPVLPGWLLSLATAISTYKGNCAGIDIR